MAERIYMTVTEDLEKALALAPEAGVVDGEEAPVSRRARGWALYGYRRWQEDREREQKLAAYDAIGADAEHLEAIRAANRRAVEGGIL